MKKLLMLILCTPLLAAAQNRLKDKPAASSPAADDRIYIDGTTNGVRALDPAYFATADQGALAATALQPAAIGTTVEAHSANLDAWALLLPASYSTSAQIAAGYQPLASVLTNTTASYTTAIDTRLANTSGTNTGDQDLSAYATTAAVAAAYQPLTTVLTNTTASYTTAIDTRLANTSGTNTGDQTDIPGNAATATALQTARTINGVSFDGTANITLPAADPAVQTLTDAATVTLDITKDGGVLGTLSQDTTINITGTPAQMHRYVLRLKSTTSRALTWGTGIAGSLDTPLESATTGGGKIDYFTFMYDSTDAKLHYVGRNFGF